MCAACERFPWRMLAQAQNPESRILNPESRILTQNQVDNMRKFVMINTLAVIKITKKHDKHQQRQLQKDMVRT